MPALTERAGQDELLAIRNDLMTVYAEIGEGDDRLFPLRYARAAGQIPLPVGPGETYQEADEALPPIMILPDGPGTASVLPYDVLRRMMTQRGLDVIMMEHRGVGLSRLDAEGHDLPAASMTIDAVLADVLAVLDHAGAARAVLYGSGYGAYVAMLVAIRHPECVHSLVLDSPRVSAEDDDASRRAFRRAYLDGTDERTESIARVIRRLIADGVIDGGRAGAVIAAVHEYGGPEAVADLVDLLVQDRGRLTWQSIREVISHHLIGATPYLQENDLVSRIARTQLGIGAEPDGIDLDPVGLLSQRSEGAPPFAGEPYDLRALAGQIAAPTIILSGQRDMISPPEIAADLASRIPGAVLLSLPRTGHSVLDAYPLIAIIAAWWSAAGCADLLVERTEELVHLPRVSVNRAVSEGLHLALAAERLSPWKLRWETARARRADAEVDPSGRRARRTRTL